VTAVVAVLPEKKSLTDTWYRIHSEDNQSKIKKGSVSTKKMEMICRGMQLVDIHKKQQDVNNAYHKLIPKHSDSS
jgi:hypothetical protein